MFEPGQGQIEMVDGIAAEIIGTNFSTKLRMLNFV